MRVIRTWTYSQQNTIQGLAGPPFLFWELVLTPLSNDQLIQKCCTLFSGVYCAFQKLINSLSETSSVKLETRTFRFQSIQIMQGLVTIITPY